MLNPPPGDALVFLLDVDNTLLDNDRFAADLTAYLDRSFGPVERERYWTIYAALRDESGYADYLGALQRFRSGLDADPALLQMSAYLLDYPFADLLYPHALDVIAHLRTLGRPVILSDGDIVFQPRKIQRSGLWNALHGDVLIDVHKQSALAAMQARYPSAHYVMVDDKNNLLADMKKSLGDLLTTMFVRQGHYAVSSAKVTPAADLEIETIAALLHCGREHFLPKKSVPATTKP